MFKGYTPLSRETVRKGMRVVAIDAAFSSKNWEGQTGTVVQLPDLRDLSDNIVYVVFDEDLDGQQGRARGWFVHRFAEYIELDWDKPLQTRSGHPVVPVESRSKVERIFDVTCPDGKVRRVFYSNSGAFYRTGIESPMDIVNGT